MGCHFIGNFDMRQFSLNALHINFLRPLQHGSDLSSSSDANWEVLGEDLLIPIPDEVSYRDLFLVR